MTHTQGEIELSVEHVRSIGVNWIWLITTDARQRVARIVCYRGEEEEHKENARRITAMWNALQGFSTEAIEAGAVRGLANAAEKLSDAERGYRLCHDVKGDGHIETGRAWDYMRKCGDDLRTALSQLAEASNGA